MTNGNSKTIQFATCKRRSVEARFDGGAVSSNGGVLLLRQIDRKLGLCKTVANRLDDPRQQGKIHHRLVDLVRQRVFGIALGYEDLNDHQDLRDDPGLQTALGRDRVLASPASLCRFENRASRAWALEIHEQLIRTFIARHSKPPKELVLDFDATDDQVHGNQEKRFFTDTTSTTASCLCMSLLAIIC